MMSQIHAAARFLFPFVFLGSILLFHPRPCHSMQDAFDLLKKHIIAYNLKAIDQSIIDGSYRGEEGILRIRPGTANSLGIQAYRDEDYADSIRLYRNAEKYLEEAKHMMAAREKEKDSGFYIERIADNFLLYRRSKEQAEEKIMIYRSRINPGLDERLDTTITEKRMVTLLEDSFAKTEYRLRDGLAYFYNRCRGLHKKRYPLTPGNVQFVNTIFNTFLDLAHEESLSLFDLDRNSSYPIDRMPSNWKTVADPAMLKFADIIEAVCRSSGDTIYAVDPLLFIALLKKESDFDPLSVSSVGAVGLTQIMPRTAKDMGMNNIHLPEYYIKAESLIREERELRRLAISSLFRIDESNRKKYAKQARKLMQRSLDIALEREKLFSRYKRELLNEMTDDRLQPEIAIKYGFRYFAGLMRDQNGDISLALASYNAGPHRVKEYKGIPPFSETVGFRNRILKYYHDYRNRLEKR